MSSRRRQPSDAGHSPRVHPQLRFIRSGAVRRSSGVHVAGATSYGRGMRTEPPAERLHRRLSSDGLTAPPTTTDSEDTSLSRWLPTASQDDGPALARGDQGRSGTRRAHRAGGCRGGRRAGHGVHPDAGQSAAGRVGETAAGADGFVVRASPQRQPSRRRMPTSRWWSASSGWSQTRSGDAATGRADRRRGRGGRRHARRCRHDRAEPGAPVADGEQIVVGMAPAPGQPTALGSGVTPSSGRAGARRARPPRRGDRRPDRST